MLHHLCPLRDHRGGADLNCPRVFREHYLRFGTLPVHVLIGVGRGDSSLDTDLPVLELPVHAESSASVRGFPRMDDIHERAEFALPYPCGKFRIVIYLSEILIQHCPGHRRLGLVKDAVAGIRPDHYGHVPGNAKVPRADRFHDCDISSRPFGFDSEKRVQVNAFAPVFLTHPFDTCRAAQCSVHLDQPLHIFVRTVKKQGIDIFIDISHPLAVGGKAYFNVVGAVDESRTEITVNDFVLSLIEPYPDIDNLFLLTLCLLVGDGLCVRRDTCRQGQCRQSAGDDSRFHVLFGVNGET